MKCMDIIVMGLGQMITASEAGEEPHLVCDDATVMQIQWGSIELDLTLNLGDLLGLPPRQVAKRLREWAREVEVRQPTQRAA